MMYHALRLSSLTVMLLCGAITSASAAAEAGSKLYEARCARCHGKNGEGTKRYKQPLTGDRSLAQLTKVIQETMPEDDPESLSDSEAKAVSQFVFDRFYSPLAQERNRPARIDLARLTVNQYRNAVADVINSFRYEPDLKPQPGLKAEYYKNRRFRNTDRVLERIDAQVAFDFGTETPVPGKTEPNEFSIRWTGAILPPETGEYTLVLRTEHAARLWINDRTKPLLDAWVKSGKDTEYTDRIFLVAGRVYHLQLEYSKAKQGVDDSNKQKTKPPSPKSSMTMLWAIPHRGVTEVIASQYLSPSQVPEQFICDTNFPPDDRSNGWVRGTSISKEWDQATTDAAIAAVNYVSTKIEELAGLRGANADRAQKLKTFCQTFAERAFRRPLTKEQKAILVDRPFEAGQDLELAVKRSVLMTLLSPYFLYREVADENDSYDVAARLSFGLWDSIPDQKLLREAAAGRLKTRAQIAAQAERMLQDPRAKAKLRGFLLTWLKVDQSHDLNKDPKQFPGFTPEVIADLRTSLEKQLDEVVWSEKSDFRQLFQEEQLYLNGRLAKYYGVKLPEDAPFQKVTLDPGKRAGVLSHPYIMTTFAHNAESSPIHRGVFLARGLLGLAMRPPPEAVTPLTPDLHPSLTTRERVALQTRPAACMTCHGIINPLGFTFEHFDAVGRYRESEKSKPIDAHGSYLARDGKRVEIEGVRELAQFLTRSEEAQEAFCEQMFHHLIQQPVKAYGSSLDADLRKNFVQSGFHIRKLVVEILTQAAGPKPPIQVSNQN